MHPLSVSVSRSRILEACASSDSDTYVPNNIEALFTVSFASLTSLYRILQQIRTTCTHQCLIEYFTIWWPYFASMSWRCLWSCFWHRASTSIRSMASCSTVALSSHLYQSAVYFRKAGKKRKLNLVKFVAKGVSLPRQWSENLIGAYVAKFYHCQDALVT